jgi:serine/threonine-protein phosphatase CPPED1
MSFRALIFSLLMSALAVCSAAQPGEPWFFAVLSDPQMGMYAKDKNFAQESSNLEFAVKNLNRLRPRFVVVCGDLVNRTGDPGEIAEYKRILKELDPAIPVYNVAGNHDVGNVPSPATLKSFRADFGRDFYTFSESGIFGLVLDSNLIGSPEKVVDAAREQEDWLKRTLDGARAHPEQQVVVFQHIPYFVRNPGEADGYFNIPHEVRRKYLDLLEKAGVKYVFAGHYHRNGGGKDGSLTEIVSGAVGMPIGESLSGFRIVAVNGTRIDSQWYCLGGIPNQIDARSLSPSHCPQ